MTKFLLLKILSLLQDKTRVQKQSLLWLPLNKVLSKGEITAKSHKTWVLKTKSILNQFYHQNRQI